MFILPISYLEIHVFSFFFLYLWSTKLILTPVPRFHPAYHLHNHYALQTTFNMFLNIQSFHATLLYNTAFTLWTVLWIDPLLSNTFPFLCYQTFWERSLPFISPTLFEIVLTPFYQWFMPFKSFALLSHLLNLSASGINSSTFWNPLTNLVSHSCHYLKT